MRTELGFLSCLLAAFSLFAQSPLGTVTGLAIDPSASPIPGATVRLMNVNTGIEVQATTNASGAYSFPNLLPGDYQITAEAKGFRQVATSVFPVAAYRTVRQDLDFALATAATEVTVVETVSPVIQLESPSINSTLTTKQILELPTTLRSVYNAAGDSSLIFTIMPLTIPGVNQVSNGAKWLVPGGGSVGMKLKVDGIETNFGLFGSPDPVSQPSMESVQEFTANILTNRAEFGGLGTITTVTRSGANDLHGDVFWHLRNSALDARNTFATSKPFQNIHNYGVSAGGPLIKDKTFWYGTWDETRGSRAYLFTANVPTVAERAGDFSAAAALRNPYTGMNSIGDGNRILPQYISPQAQRAQEILFPLPNFGPPDLRAGNYRASFNGPELHQLFEIRLDHNFASGHSLFARYQHKDTSYDIPGARTQLPPSSVGTSNNTRVVNFWTVGDVYSIRPNIVNEFRAGLVILVSESSADVTGQPLLDRIGIRGLPDRTGVEGVPNMSITGYTSVGQLLLNPVNDGHGQFSNNLTWIKGRHSLKFGVEMVRWFVNRHLPAENALFGNFNFTNRFTGNPYADFLLGLPNSVTRLDPYRSQYFRFTDWNFYGQDDFKVTPKLTLSYGLRYEYNGPASTRDGNIYSFDPASGSIVIPSEDSRRLFSPYWPADVPVITADQLGAGKSLRETDKNNFAPRFGFSYQIGNDARTVLRGGWGVYYSHLSANVAAGLAAGPYAISTTSNNSFVDGQPLFTFENPFAAPGAAGSLNVNAVDTRLLNSYAMQYSLSLERQVTQDIGVRISYIGSKGTQVLYRRNINQPQPSTAPFSASRRPYPRFNTIAWGENGANDLYSGLQTQVQKRFSKGLLFSSTWTWAKSISEVTIRAILAETSIENAYDRARDRSDVYSVPRHQWMNQVLYELPGRGALLGGWQVNVLLNLSTGNFLNPVFSGSDPSNTNTIGGRPDVVKSSAEGPGTQTEWFDRTAFAVPPANSARFGNAGRNLIQGPGYVIFNAGIAKSFSLERLGRFQVGVSFQNILNHVNLGQPNMTINNPVGGTITSTHIFPPAGSPRNGLLSLRWSF